jgi:hypothetical protein
MVVCHDIITIPPLPISTAPIMRRTDLTQALILFSRFNHRIFDVRLQDLFYPKH